MHDSYDVPANGWTPHELAEHLEVGIGTVRRHTYHWPHHRVGGRHIRFLPDDVAKIRALWFIPINQENDSNPVQQLQAERRKRERRRAS